MNVTVTAVTEPDALFCHYESEYRPQPCYLALDLSDGELSCDYRAGVGNARSMAEFHGRVLVADIPTLTADAANRLMESVREDAQLVLDGSEIEWDGNNNIGRLSDDARAAWERIVEACDPQNYQWDDSQMVGEYDASDWFREAEQETIDRLGLTADSTDAEVAAMADAETTEATTMAAGYTILVGAEAWLSGRRDELRQAVAEAAEQAAKDAAEAAERRNNAVLRMARWGDDRYSDRTIAAIVEKTHTWVGNLRRAAVIDLAEDAAAALEDSPR